MIGFFNDGSDYRPPFKGKVAEWLGMVAANEGRRMGAVNFVFCSPGAQLETNRNFLGHDWPTDVITFDYSTGVPRQAQEPTAANIGVVSGDIFIDPAEVARNAARFFVDPRAEMRRVMVHGVLHLCGYKDGSPKEQKQMRAKEDHYLARFYATV